MTAFERLLMAGVPAAKDAAVAAAFTPGVAKVVEATASLINC